MAELEAWAAAGLTATLWWRDDDATEPNHALWRLRRISEAARVPVTLGVIPAAARPALVGMVESWMEVTPVQHGFSHTNHARSGAGQAEFTANRPLAEMVAELRAGDRIMKELFGARALPVLVPPWNRIPATLAAILDDQGFIGLSTHSARDLATNRTWCRRWVRATASRALNSLSERRWEGGETAVRRAVVTVGATIDVMDWRSGRFLGERRVLEHAVHHLRWRRLRQAGCGLPTGLLTHHGDMDEDSWDFVERFAAVATSHPAARWLTGPEVFLPVGASSALRAPHGGVRYRLPGSQVTLKPGTVEP